MNRFPARTARSPLVVEWEQKTHVGSATTPQIGDLPPNRAAGEEPEREYCG